MHLTINLLKERVVTVLSYTPEYLTNFAKSGGNLTYIGTQ